MTRLSYSAGRARRLAKPLMSDPLGDVESTYAAAVWTAIVEAGDRIAGALVHALGPVEALRRVVAGDDLRDAAGATDREWTDALQRWRPRFVQEEVDATFEIAARNGVRLVTPSDVVWPRGLDDLGFNAPLCLWVRGDPAVLSRLSPSVALVGARAASGYGEQVTRELADQLTGRGFGIVSGAAYGIDGAAHRAALEADGLTVAFMAGGVERHYPTGHHDLIDRIARTGAVVSEVPSGGVPTKWRFLARNRLIAAAADATVIVEAGWRSGSLNTANHASELGRPLGAVPGPVTSPTSAGCHRLLRDASKQAQCITGVDDVVALVAGGGLFSMAAEPSRTPASERRATDDRTRVGDALSLRTARSVQEVARRSGMAVTDVRLHLGLMSLDGEATQDPAGWKRLAPAR